MVNRMRQMLCHSSSASALCANLGQWVNKAGSEETDTQRNGLSCCFDLIFGFSSTNPYMSASIIPLPPPVEATSRILSETRILSRGLQGKVTHSAMRGGAVHQSHMFISINFPIHKHSHNPKHLPIHYTSLIHTQ